MPKKDGKVRMCVDYRDLNRASPKDDFPLPHIDVLVDTGSSLNVLPKSTLARLSYQGAPMRYNGVVVKVFDGSQKTVI